jgi:hypothetical protein
VPEVRTRKEAITIFLGRIRKAYVDNQRSAGITASGKSAASLKEKPQENSGLLTGSSTFYFQKFGRKPGKFPSIQAIIEWLKEKKTFRIDDERGPGLKALAFLIARKIAKKGTDIYLKKRPALVIIEQLLEARKEIALSLLALEKQTIKSKLKHLQDVAKNP